MDVTLYYDKQDDFYPAIVALLNEYRSANPRISVTTVDYVRDAGEAQKIKEQYKLNAPTDKNLVIFDCEKRVKIVNGDSLTQVKLEQVPNPKEREFRRKPIAFNGRTDVHLDVAGRYQRQAVQGVFFAGPRRTLAQ